MSNIFLPKLHKIASESTIYVLQKTVKGKKFYILSVVFLDGCKSLGIPY